MSAVTEMGIAVRSSARRKKVVPPQASYGILVFSRSLELQYVNRRALEVNRKIGQTAPRGGSIVRSTQVLELRDHIHETLNERLDAKVWDPFEVSRVLSAGGERLLLRGIGCPNPAASQYSRIIIVFEKIRPEDDAEPVGARSKAPERRTARPGLRANA